MKFFVSKDAHLYRFENNKNILSSWSEKNLSYDYDPTNFREKIVFFNNSEVIIHINFLIHSLLPPATCLLLPSFFLLPLFSSPLPPTSSLFPPPSSLTLLPSSLLLPPSIHLFSDQKFIKSIRSYFCSKFEKTS